MSKARSSKNATATTDIPTASSSKAGEIHAGAVKKKGNSLLNPLPLPHQGVPPKKENAKLVTMTKIGDTMVRYQLDFETEEVPALGSDAMFDAIFKAAKTCGKITTTDLRSVERDRKKLWKSQKKKKTEKEKPKEIETKKEEVKEVEDDFMDLSQDQELLDLLAEADEILNLSSSSSPPQLPSTSPKEYKTDACVSRKHSKKNAMAVGKNVTKISPTAARQDVVELSSDEELPMEVEATVSQDSADDNRGSLICFKVHLLGFHHPIWIHENKKMEEVRNMVSKKANLPAEGIKMFLGDEVVLDDDDLTVKDAGLKNLSIIDAYYKEQTDEQLYFADSEHVFRFKLQTSDRRGRQTVYIYTKKNIPMRNVRDQYAKELAMDPSQLRLMFDGESIDLDRLPAACDLEGEECIDVIIK